MYKLQQNVQLMAVKSFCDILLLNKVFFVIVLHSYIIVIFFIKTPIFLVYC